MRLTPVAAALQHAILSASSSKKWLTCTPSARVEEHYPDEQSVYAKEGVLAHDVVKWGLEYAYHGTFIPEHVNTTEKRRALGYTDAMLDAAKAFLDMAKAITDPLVAAGIPFLVRIEKRLDYSAWVPEGFGTGDLVIISPHCIWVRDFKYGTGVAVEADENSQMMLYGLGAWAEAEFAFDGINEVDLGIFQPRIKHFPSWRTTLKSLLGWGETIRPVAAKAWAGEGERVAGAHCFDFFCRARFECPAVADKALAIASEEFFDEPERLSPARIAELLPQLPLLEKWSKGLREFALRAAVDDGVKYPGFKLVAGRSNRFISDQKAAAVRLVANGVPQDRVMTEPTLVGLTALEEAVGAKRLQELLGDLIVKPAGAPALVPESDKRPVWQPVSTPEDDFGL